MDVAQLRAFLTVAEELHFGRAAERLHMAQPPLSRMIKHFERELGSQLFDRNTRSVRLTATGSALLAPAREVLESIRRAEGVVRLAEHGEIGLVRISFAGISTHRLLARLARVVRQQRPGVQLELHSQNFALPLMKRLLDGETDIALGRWDVVPSDVHSQVVMHDSLVVAVPDTHALAGASSVTGALLEGQTFVSLPPYEGSVLPDRLRRLARANGFVPDVVQIAPDTQTALALVSAEVGCHLTLRSVSQNSSDPHVVFIPLVEPLAGVDLQAAWRRDDRAPALLAVIHDVLELDQPVAD